MNKDLLCIGNPPESPYAKVSLAPRKRELLLLVERDQIGARTTIDQLAKGYKHTGYVTNFIDMMRENARVTFRRPNPRGHGHVRSTVSLELSTMRAFLYGTNYHGSYPLREQSAYRFLPLLPQHLACVQSSFDCNSCKFLFHCDAASVLMGFLVPGSVSWTTTHLRGRDRAPYYDGYTEGAVIDFYGVDFISPTAMGDDLYMEVRWSSPPEQWIPIYASYDVYKMATVKDLFVPLAKTERKGNDVE